MRQISSGKEGVTHQWTSYGDTTLECLVFLGLCCAKKVELRCLSYVNLILLIAGIRNALSLVLRLQQEDFRKVF